MEIGLIASTVGIVIATSTLGTTSPIPPPYEPPPKVFVADAVPYAVKCACVTYIREAFDIPIRGDAWTIKGNTKKADAVPGDVALIDYPGTSHAALITEVGTSTFHVKESNWSRCKETTRVIAKSSVRGIFRPA